MVMVNSLSDTMKRLTHIALAFLCFAVGQVPRAEATVLAEKPDAEALLEIALLQDKVLGQVDSAATAYRHIIELHRLGQARRETADRARGRLAWLGRPESSSPASDPDSLQGRADLSGALLQVTALTSRLQLGNAPSPTSGAAMSMPQENRSNPLDARRRWLAKVILVRQSRALEGESMQPSFLQKLGSGMDTLRKMLGLKGLLHYVEEELRRRRPRPLTAHEQLLWALAAEKEHRDFGSALGRYRDVVRLSPDPEIGPGHEIAIRLAERARQGLERCAQWQRTTAAGS